MGRRKVSMTEVQEVLYQKQQGRSERQIARSLNMSRNTVRRILKQAQAIQLESNNQEGRDQERVEEGVHTYFQLYMHPSSRYSPAQKYIAAHHEQIATWRLMPHMTVNQMVRLFAEQGKKVSEMSLRRYIRTYFPAISTPIIHLDVIPGSQGQVDFCSLSPMIDPLSGKRRKTYAFIMTLSFSRHRFVRFVFSQDIQTWIDCHVRAFHFFGGVPATILLDNLKAGVVSADFYDPTLNRSYAECERHYGFVADPTKIRTPRHKGKVERSVQLVRQQILAGRTFKDIEEANTYALHWCRYEIAQRVTRTTGKTPWDLFDAIEKGALKPLPLTDYECALWCNAKVHRDQHVVFEGSFYSVPNQFMGKTIWVRASHRLVELYYEEKKIKTHVRTAIKGQWITDTHDYPQYAYSFLEKDTEHCLEEAKKIGASTAHLIQIVLEKESLTNRRKAQAILRLADHYGSCRLESACKRALHFHNYRYKSLKHMLEEHIDQLETTPQTSPSIRLKNGSYLRLEHEFTSLNVEQEIGL